MEAEKKLTGYPSIDKPWLKYYTDEAINAPLPECTIYEYMYNNNKDYPDDIAILFINKKIKYKELFSNIDKTEKAFIAQGVKKGDIVTVAMPSIPEALYCVYALNKIGAVANMIHPLASKNEICHYLNEVKSEIFVMFTGTYELIKDSISKTSVKKAIVATPVESLAAPVQKIFAIKNKLPRFNNNSVFISWKEFIKSGKDIETKYVSHDVNEMAIISHTGGTTGEPKGVMCSDKNINAVIWQIIATLFWPRQDCYMSVLPPFINYSLVNSMLEPLVAGAKVVLIPDYKTEKFVKYVKQYHPNYISSIPPYWEAMLSNKNIQKADFSCLKKVYYGGEAMSAQLEDEVNESLLNCGAEGKLLKGLGQTELMSCATVTYEDCNEPGSVGVPLVKTICKIVEPETTDEKTYNTEGEICFSAPALMIGYYENKEATNSIIKIHPDGSRYLHTGDLGYISENGVLFITGRLKRIIMTKGNDGIATKMFPDRIEKVILGHPAVSLCCIVGIEDSVRMHYPKAYVVLNNGYEKSETITNEILDICKEQLPAYMVPDIIEYRDDLPRTSRGKVDYRALEQEAEKLN